MALKLTHTKLKGLLDATTGLRAYPIYIPETAQFPAIAYSMTGLSRDIQSNLSQTTISMATYAVHVAAPDFSATQALAQKLIDKLDQYADQEFLLVLIEDAADDFDPEHGLFIKTLSVTTRFKE